MAEEGGEQQSQPLRGYNSYNNHASEGTIKFQLSFDDLIEDIEHNLQCEEPFLDAHGLVQWRCKKGSVPLINDAGFNRLKTIIGCGLNRNAPLSNLKDEEIMNICKDIENNIADTLFDNWNEFEIIDVTCATTIREVVGNTIFINMKKSNEGAFLRHLRSTQNVTEINQIQRAGALKSSEKLNIMGRLFGRT